MFEERRGKWKSSGEVRDEYSSSKGVTPVSHAITSNS